ncbi:MAG: hypothetical protein J7M25_06775, partial [Deltaproteobacteria bacterium]|nr:hypothetical protein [Deltaproteobacteria bacterium]
MVGHHCRPGSVWNARSRRCQEVLRCTGGKVRAGNRCVCPAGTTWNLRYRRCVRPTVVGHHCRPGSVWNARSRRCQKVLVCTGGKVRAGNR